MFVYVLFIVLQNVSVLNECFELLDNCSYAQTLESDGTDVNELLTWFNLG